MFELIEYHGALGEVLGNFETLAQCNIAAAVKLALGASGDLWCGVAA